MVGNVRGGWGVSCRFSLPSACVFWVEFVSVYQFLGVGPSNRSSLASAHCGSNGGGAVGVNDPQTGPRWAVVLELQLYHVGTAESCTAVFV